jgi:uncharacterized YccA/Bax inhibitor family protein
MQSNNPVFARSEGFNGKGSNAYGNTTYPGNGQSYAGYGDPSQWSTGSAAGYGAPTSAGPTADQGRMTIDTVVQKTGFTLLVVVLAAAATWVLTPAVTSATQGSSALRSLYVLSAVGAFGGFALSLVNSFKRIISPALVIGYAVFEGIFIGAMSKVFGNVFGESIVVGAVLGTIAATGGTLAAYKFFNITVSDKFRKWVVAMMFGFVAVTLLDVVMGLFHASFGFNGLGGMGLVSSLIGLGLGVLMLILDFDFVERGIAAGLPERESWRAAFGLTVTIVWIYIELLRILAIFSRR